MPEMNLKEANKALAAKGKRTHQAISAIPAELKELAAKKARLEAKVGVLKREKQRRRDAAKAPRI
jgi:hypothetical protein